MTRISKRADKTQHMVVPGLRDAGVMPSGDNPSAAGLMLDYRAIQLGDGTKTSFADDELDVEDDIYDKNGNIDIVKLWSSNKSAFENEVNMRRERTKANFKRDNYPPPSPSPWSSREFNRLVDLWVAEALWEKIQNSGLDVDHYIAAYGNNPPLTLEILVEKTPQKSHISATDDGIDAYNDHTHGSKGAFVGDKEEGFELRRNISKLNKSFIKRGYPDYIQYFDSSLYDQVSERNPEYTKQFDLFNTYFASDGNDTVEIEESVYHSSPEEFVYFDPTKSRELGFHFGSKKQADHRAQLTGGKTKAYRIHIKHPLRLQDAYRWNIKNTLDKMVEANIIPPENLKQVEDKLINTSLSLAKKSGEGLTNVSVRTLANFIKSLGYDGIEYQNRGEGGGKAWIVFDSEQIEIVEPVKKQAFVKTAITYDSNPIIQKLISIPQVKALIEQTASSFVDKIIVTTPSADIQQTTQQLKNQSGDKPVITLQQISGDPYGHVWVGEENGQKKPLDKTVRIDRVTDEWGTLVVILHECLHLVHPNFSESQVQSEAENLAGAVKQFLTPKQAKKHVLFVKSGLSSLPVVECDIADSFSKQVIGLQKHNSLNPNAGMVFTYPLPQPLSFHMGTVSFPIDIVFAGADSKIVKIYRNCKPNSSDIYSCSNASKVIEVCGSFCAYHDLNEGDQVFSADDSDIFNQEDFTQFVLEKIRSIKLLEQEDLEMTDWNIKVVMKKTPDVRRFLKVSWSEDDYALKKAEIFVNPDPILIKAALQKMSLDKLVRHSLLHILAGHKEELKEDEEYKMIGRWL